MGSRRGCAHWPACPLRMGPSEPWPGPQKFLENSVTDEACLLPGAAVGARALQSPFLEQRARSFPLEKIPGCGTSAG